MVKRLSVLSLVALLVLSMSVVAAQTKPTATPSTVAEVCKGAQAWYDAIDGEALATNFSTAIKNDGKLSARFASVEVIRSVASELGSGDVPDCIAQARDWYVDGLTKLSDGIAAFIDDSSEVGDFAVALAASIELIGQYRGYLTARGVTVAEIGTRSFILF